MKIIAFNGSPRRGGNTEMLLEEAVKGAREKSAEVIVYNLNTMRIKSCQHCGGCDHTATCVIDDDMLPILENIRDCDRIIMASPVFFLSVSAQTKIAIDRCQSFWVEKYLRKKPINPGPFGRKGLLILVGGMKGNIGSKGFECAEVVARAFFRTVSVPEHVALQFDSMDAKGAIKGHPTALQEAYEAGKRLATF